MTFETAVIVMGRMPLALSNDLAIVGVYVSSKCIFMGSVFRALRQKTPNCAVQYTGSAQTLDTVRRGRRRGRSRPLMKSLKLQRAMIRKEHRQSLPYLTKLAVE